MDIEAPFEEKKSSLPTIAMVLWLSILTLLVVLYMLKSAKTEAPQAVSEAKAVKVSRKIAAPESRPDVKLADGQILQLSELQNKLVELDRQIGKSEKARVELQKNQEVVIEKLMKKVNELEGALASGGQSRRASQGQSEISRTFAAADASAATGEATVIRKKRIVNKPAKLPEPDYSPVEDVDMEYLRARKAESVEIRPLGRFSAASPKPATTSSVPSGGYPPAPRFSSETFVRRGNDLKETYRSDFRPLYEEKTPSSTTSGAIVIYATPNAGLSSWSN